MQTVNLPFAGRRMTRKAGRTFFPPRSSPILGGNQESFTRFKSPRGRSDVAKCNVLVKATRADLDYAAFASFNDEHGMDLRCTPASFCGYGSSSDCSRRVEGV